MSAVVRSYFLPVSANCLPGCELCEFIGCRNARERSWEDVERALTRARSADFGKLLVPGGFLLSPLAERLYQACIESSLFLEILISASSLTPELLKELESWARRGVSLNLALSGREAVTPEDLTELENRFPGLSVTFVPLQKGSPLVLLKSMSETLRRSVRFQFPPWTENSESVLSVSEIHDLIRRIQQTFPGFTPLPPEDRESWDPRISEDLCLEPVIEPSYAFRIPGSAPEISVVIPSYNSGALLKNTLRHLLEQDLSRSRYEIIVVDDGSTDGTEERIRNFVAPEASCVNFTYLYFPRSRARTLGDGQFRAGIARNLGVKRAQGSHLAFLDSDMIVPRDYLSDLLVQHESWDVIQCARHHIRDCLEGRFVRFDEIRPEKDTYVLEPGYWGPFFKTKEWSSIPFFWKYTCTYALSLRTDHFKKAGWFRRTFVHYGFEDTDLGYRLASQGRSFHLSPRVIYHLPDERSEPQSRSEYQRSRVERHLLLSKTAKIFFLNTLDPRVFEHFRSFMGGERSWRRILISAFGRRKDGRRSPRLSDPVASV